MSWLFATTRTASSVAFSQPEARGLSNVLNGVGLLLSGYLAHGRLVCHLSGAVHAVVVVNGILLHLSGTDALKLSLTCI